MQIKFQSNKNKRNGGQVIMGALLLFLTISITVLVGIATPVAIQVRTASDFLQSKQGYIAADVLNEEALYRLNQGRTLPASLVLSFNNSTSTALITDVGGIKEIIATGVSGDFTRFSKSVFTQGEGLSINYGLQVGDGGITMTGSSKVKGNVISNGNIVGSGSVSITGSAVASTASTQTTDQTNGSGAPSVNTAFGKNNATQDFAQSFVVSTTTTLARVMFYIKKTGSPSNATVRIVTNSGSSPSTTTLTSGTLSATQVSSSYGWVPVTFVSDISLVPGTTYWLVVDVSSNSTSKYYTMGVSNTNSYANGSIKLGRYNSTWTSESASNDAFFQVYMGDVSSISGMIIGGNANAYTVNNSTVSGTLACQGGSGNNKSCDTASSTPTPTTFPFSESNISSWKADAVAGGTHNGDISVGGSNSTSTGPLKINGNLTLSASSRMTVNGTLHVTGDLTISGSAKLDLDPSYGATSGVVVVDGKINIAASGAISGSGTSGSYVVFVTTSGCGGTTSCSGVSAITVSGSAGAVVLLAPDGQVSFSGSASAKAVVSYSMSLTGSTELIYESGLADIDFNSGPSGAWVTDSWKEIYQ